MMPVTLERLLRESRLPGERPFRIPAGRAQQAQLEALKRQIDADDAHTNLLQWDNRDVLRIEVLVPGSRGRGYSYHHHLDVFFTGDDLWIGPAYYGKGAVPCAGIDQIRRTLAAMRERLTDETRRAQKREKLRKLKVRAIESQASACTGA